MRRTFKKVDIWTASWWTVELAAQRTGKTVDEIERLAKSGQINSKIVVIGAATYRLVSRVDVQACVTETAPAA